MEWLRDSSGELNYARVIGSIMLLIFQPILIIYAMVQGLPEKVENIYQWLLLGFPSVVAVILFLIDFFRDKNNLKIQLGALNVEYNNRKEDTDVTEIAEE